MRSYILKFLNIEWKGKKNLLIPPASLSSFFQNSISWSCLNRGARCGISRFQLGRKMRSLAIADCSTWVRTWLGKDVGDDEKMNKKNIHKSFTKYPGNFFTPRLGRAGGVWQPNECTLRLEGNNGSGVVLVKSISLWLVQKMPRFKCPANTHWKHPCFQSKFRFYLKNIIPRSWYIWMFFVGAS